MEEARPRKSMDDILADIRTLADGAEKDADRLRALKMLKDMETSGVALPKPLTAEERLERLIRILRGAGREDVRRAWRKIWPVSKLRPDTPPSYQEAKLLDDQDRKIIQKIQGLKQLYRFFPELMPPTGGIPNGFPLRGRLVQIDWCREQARKIIIDRKVQGMQKPIPGGERDGESASQEAVMDDD